MKESTDILNERLRQLPSVNEMIGRVVAAGWLSRHPRTLIASVVRASLNEIRQKVMLDQEHRLTLDADSIQIIIEQQLESELRPPLSSVINATGIILHTGLGRAPIADAAVEVLTSVARGYAPVEIDLESGKRGKRSRVVRSLLCELTGAESATVVNNTAAAVMITLATLAKDREVIVSRGELVEIGGSFRLPDVVEAGGAQLREVGTTNKTRLSDFEDAINDRTAALFKVHPSNFRIHGFTQDVAVDELASLGCEHDLPVLHDIGSGMLTDPSEYGLLLEEPNARESIQAGADLVMFSGDKLLGATQAGIIVGREALIDRIERHPMMRAMRVDKTTLSVLGRVLQIHRDPRAAAKIIPALRMASDSLETVAERTNALVDRLADICGSVEVRTEQTHSCFGGGSVPGQNIPSRSLVIRPTRISADDLARRLRMGNPSVVARIADDGLWIDLRTVFDEQIDLLAEAIHNALNNFAAGA